MHKGEDPLFILRAVSFHKTALSRQTGEAVRIRRRGGEGAVLNSKAEFNRCYIPRLRVVGEEELTEVREQEERDLLLVGERLGAGDVAWERNKRSKRAEFSKGSLTSNAGGAKRLSKDHGGGARPSKRRKFALLEGNWGLETTLKTTPTEAKTTPEEAKTILVEDSQEPGCQEYQEAATGSQSTNQTGHPGAASGSRRLVDQECLTGQHGVGTSGAVQYTAPPTDQPETPCRSTATPSHRSTHESKRIATLLEYWGKKEEAVLDHRPSLEPRGASSGECPPDLSSRVERKTFDENAGSALMEDGVSLDGSEGVNIATMSTQTGGDDRGGVNDDVGRSFDELSTTPSTARRGKLVTKSAYRHGVSTSGSVGNNENVRCKVGGDKRCEIHGCPAKKNKLKTQKWHWVEKWKEYG